MVTAVLGGRERRVLTSPAGVENHSVHVPAAGDPGHGRGVAHEFGAHVLGDRPAHQPPGVQVDDGGEVHEARCADRYTRDVAAPFLVRARGSEVSFHQVGDVPGGRVGHGGDHALAPVALLDPVLAHHPLDPLAVDRSLPGPLAARREFGVDPAHP
jgi:hypothetical protein